MWGGDGREWTETAPVVTKIPELAKGEWVGHCRKCGHVGDVGAPIPVKCYACDQLMYAVMHLPDLV
jgi:hypothetical protein